MRPLDIEVENQRGAPPRGEYHLGDVRALLPDLIKSHGGQVQVVYVDPPFFSGQAFSMRVRVGEKDWKSGVGSLVRAAYDDRWQSRQAYLDLMREVLSGVRQLLCDTGVVYVHLDFRMSAHVRLLMDEIFGERNFLNEIIWAYQTGGRARRYFSRKHDTILFYRKTGKYHFDIESVPIPREGARRNHMRRQVDQDGRFYRTIRSGGKIYTYYDDEPTYPGDVWDDVSHLQQKDPQRTGYDTQKPIKLLERIILSSSKPGDLVCDLFCGSGTTLEAAARTGRRFLGADASPYSLMATRRRLLEYQVTYYAKGDRASQGVMSSLLEGGPHCFPEVDISLSEGVGLYQLKLHAFSVEPGLCARRFQGLDAVDNWCAGYIRQGAFVPYAHLFRSKAKPGLSEELLIPMLEGSPVARIEDVAGRHFYFEIEPAPQRGKADIPAKER